MTTIVDISPNTAPVGQWIYIVGTEFDLENTQIYFGEIKCEQYVIVDSNIIEAVVPLGCQPSCNIKLVINTVEFISDTVFTLRVITDPPIATGLIIDGVTQWVRITGDNFVWNETTISFNDIVVKASVDAPTLCGFRKNVDDVVTSVTVQTPNGSVSIS